MRVGIVGDIHLPFEHPLYLNFCQDMFQQWNVDAVHIAGDVADFYSVSRHGFDPDGPSPYDETERTIEACKPWSKAFPRATVSIGNHDLRIMRRAQTASIPCQFIRDLGEVLLTTGWDWSLSHVHDSVLYEHGTGSSGKDAAMNRAVAKRCSLVMGHVHSYGGVKWHVNDFSRIFGMNAGCGVDIDAMAMAYGRPFPVRPCLGCGIVLDGTFAYFEVMPCGPGEPYHKSRA